MHITTLTSPVVLRQYLLQDEELKRLLTAWDGTVKVFPVSAPDGTEGDFITHTRVSYAKGAVDAPNREERTVIEVEICSPDYDRLVLVLLDAVRRVIIRMRNDGIRAHITDTDEYMYSFAEGGAAWYTERVTVTLTDVTLTLNDNDN